MIFVILHAGIGLGPDEAQYWTWSQLPDWGYYSKPPGIAWEIWLGTHLFGNTELGVRALPLVIGFALPLAIFFLARRCALAPVVCFWAAVALAASPMGIMASFLAITDGGMVLCWALACAFLAGSIQQDTPPNFLLLGLLVFLGALFKWPMFTFWLLIPLQFVWMRWKLDVWRLFAGIGVSLLALLPTLYWNNSHDWATFRHVLATLTGGHAPSQAHAITAGNPLEFLGAQVALLSPILFILLLLGWWRVWRAGRTAPNGVIFCAVVSLAIFSVGLSVSLFMKIQGNWIIFAYPTAFVVLAWASSRRWLIAGVIVSIVLVTVVLSIPSVQTRGMFASTPIPYKVNPFRHNVGWQQIDPLLKAAGYEADHDFLFGDKYQTASVLSFYSPEQKRAYFFNLGGARKNQFSYWPGMDVEQQGKRGFFLVIENSPQLDNQTLPTKYLEQLQPYFNEVKYLGMKPLFHAYGKTVKGALLFECSGYHGLVPIDPELY